MSKEEKTTKEKKPIVGITPWEFHYTLKYPKELFNKQYNELSLDFKGILGTHILAIQRDMTLNGIPMGNDGLAGSMEFVSRLAARAARVTSDVIANLEWADFNAVVSRAQYFLIVGE